MNMSSPHAEITTEVLLNIFNPHETFTPKLVHAELIEISRKSARIKTHQLTRAECDTLIGLKVMSKIIIRAPFLNEALTLKADVFWAKYIVRDMTEPPFSDLGFNFRPPRPADQAALDKVVAVWERRDQSRG